MPEMKIVTRPARMISDGLCVSRDAYIVIDNKVPRRIAQQIVEFAALGLVRVETARLKPSSTSLQEQDRRYESDHS